MLSDSRMLDAQIPLTGASFRDVAGLGVDIPTRYAECYALLTDGRKVRLRRREQLLGRSGSGHRQTFYFSCEDGRILCVHTNSKRKRQIRRTQCWERVALCRAFSSVDARVRRLGSSVVRIVAIDGSLLFVSPDAEPQESTRRALARIAELLRMPPALSCRKLA